MHNTSVNMDTACETSVHTRHDWSKTDPSTAVVTAIADLENTAPETMDIVLFDYIDPEGLDTLVPAKNGSDLGVKFRIGDYDVKIEGNQLTVTRAKRNSRN